MYQICIHSSSINISINISINYNDCINFYIRAWQKASNQQLALNSPTQFWQILQLPEQTSPTPMSVFRPERPQCIPSDHIVDFEENDRMVVRTLPFSVAYSCSGVSLRLKNLELTDKPRWGLHAKLAVINAVRCPLPEEPTHPKAATPKSIQYSTY